MTATWILGIAACAGAWAQAGVERRAPVVDGKAVEVSPVVRVIDFARVTPRDESFDVTIYLELNWRDPARIRRWFC